MIPNPESYIIEYCDVFLPGDEADLVRGGADHHPGPVGAVSLEVDQQSLVVHPGHLAVLEPGAVHAVRSLNIASVAVLVVFVICNVGTRRKQLLITEREYIVLFNYWKCYPRGELGRTSIPLSV